MSIRFEKVDFCYPNGYQANSQLNLEIQEGERVAIIGQNGAGKTTAVKMMNRLFVPTRGTVWVEGIDTRTRTTAQIAQLVGYVFQNPDDQIFNQTVLAEVQYMLRKKGLSQEEQRSRADWALEQLGLLQKKRKNPFDLPLPERKFLSIASVIALRPKYVILDEPTAGLDARGIVRLERVMEELQRLKIGVVTITHDMDFVARNFTRIVVMANKKIIREGSPEEIFMDAALLNEAQIEKPQRIQVLEALGLDAKMSNEDLLEHLLERMSV